MSGADESRRGPGSGEPRWELRLYVNGMTPGDRRAVANLERICREHLPGRCSLEIVDLREDPARAEQDQILAVPTLVRHRPAPRRKVIGDLSLIDRVLAGLEIEPDPGAAGAEQEH